jgi:hypothetical protein
VEIGLIGDAFIKLLPFLSIPNLSRCCVVICLVFTSLDFGQI